MKGRKPRNEELDLWKKVTDRVTPLDTGQLAPSAILKPKPSADPIDPAKPKPIAPFKMNGGKAPVKDNIAPSLGQALQTQPVQMDKKAFRNLQRGKLKPDARIDLHGMTLDRAHGALTRFVMSSHSSGKRLLLVITGKGKNRDGPGPIPVRHGVLRHQVPEWLRLAPLNSVVMQVTQAHISHGGGGAYYVYLRRSR
ncbi:MAG: Smr/MutS family protein [Pseudomonadota bacterium]